MNIKNRELLYGRDNEENIVAIEPMRGQCIAEVFTREGDKLKSRYEPFKYFLYTTDKETIPEGTKTTKLLGSNHYNRLLEFDDVGEYYNIKKFLSDYKDAYSSSQYFLQSSKTLFNGMLFNDPLTMFFDLEVLTSDGYAFPNANREGDEIFIIAIKTNRGTEKVLYTENPNKDIPTSTTLDGVEHIKFPDEKSMLEAFVMITLSIDPDVIANHNIFNFDLDFLRTRAEMHNVKLSLGRNGSEPNYYQTNIKFADRSREYNNYHIYGRHIIDTQFLCEYADIVLRNMPSYQLKEVVKYLGEASDNRTYIPGERISDTWKNKDPDYTPEELLLYAIDDVREAEIVYNKFGQSIFTLTQMIPMGYQEVFRYGTGNQVEYVFMREYLKQKWSYPKAGEHRHISGGYADVLKFGMIKGSIIYADVKSLYPSLGKLLKINPKKDELGLYQKILNLLTDIRYDIKAKIKEYEKEGNQPMIDQQKATDGSLKIFLNTMSYGFLAFGGSSFNDYDEAERITTNGQKIVKKMIDVIEMDGGVPIKVDTDGVALKVPKDWEGREEEYCEVRLTDALPEGIIIECDGKYDGIISFDGKSYALLERGGEIKIKGNTLIGRSIETFLTDFVKECIEELFKGEQKCLQHYNKYLEKIRNKNIEPEDIAQRANINMTLDEYENKKAASDSYPTLATYELAINATKPYTKGDVIRYYVKEFPYHVTTHYNKLKLKKKKLKVFEAARLIDDYDYDFEPEYYEERLESMAKRFMCLGKDKFEEIFEQKIYPKAADVRKYEKLTENFWQ